VQLLAEDKLVGADGRLAAAGAAPNRASDLFTTSFTRHYPEIAARSPVYAQLRSVIDLLIAAAFARREDFYGRTGWTMETFGDESRYPVRTHPAPQRVACVVNSVWKGNRLLTPAGGGVSIRADEALQPSLWLADDDGQLASRRRDASEHPDGDLWWWD
jgi:hypothetical protein